VTRKITDGAARIKLGLGKQLRLGNLDAKRDWGFAGEFVEAMWQMLQLDKPQDFVIATEQTHTVRDFAKLAFETVDLRWEDHVVVDSEFVRPAEVNELIGDCSRARAAFGWRARVLLPQLVETMVRADLERLRR